MIISLKWYELIKILNKFKQGFIKIRNKPNGKINTDVKMTKINELERKSNKVKWLSCLIIGIFHKNLIWRAKIQSVLS